MIKHFLPLLPILTCAATLQAAELTPLETRWLSAGAAVLTHAKQELQLPIDITVQPQARPQDVPLALGYQDGRCKLVLSLRGNVHAEDVLAGVAAAQQPWMIEAMVAHEIGHCWRYAQGAWHLLPAGFEQAAAAPELTAQEALQETQQATLRETRREEAYADLVALAWTAQHHPQRYTAVLAWLQHVRQPQASGGGSHSTAVWLQLASSATVFASSQPWLQQVEQLWQQGLRLEH
ncbi:MAG: hypothetical protein K2P77_04815 [Burkholderiaceae bacterium]|nr:hypothetical protein [Burkholderiaceae bacterium]